MYEKQFPGTIQVIFTCLLNQKPVAKTDIERITIEVVKPRVPFLAALY
jgi:hypothetical protein